MNMLTDLTAEPALFVSETEGQTGLWFGTPTMSHFFIFGYDAG
jgi:hypothetical protein